MRTTFSISEKKVITAQHTKNGISTYTFHKMDELSSIILGLKSFEINGSISFDQFNEFHLQIIKCGFKSNMIESDSLFQKRFDFQIEYTK